MIHRHRTVTTLLSAGILTLSMSVGANAFAVGDSAGVARTFPAGDNPSPFPFYDFRVGQYKAECVSGGVALGVYAVGTAANPYGIYCASPLAGQSPVRFSQSTTSTPNPNENNEDFASHDSAHYGSHGLPDWDAGFFKGECPAGSEVVGIAKSTDASQQVSTIHCSSNAPMCAFGGQLFAATNTCHTVNVPTPGANQLTFAGCSNNELMVGMSVDLAHHPKKILCCTGQWVVC